jgi:hypothetical protein
MRVVLDARRIVTRCPLVASDAPTTLIVLYCTAFTSNRPHAMYDTFIRQEVASTARTVLCLLLSDACGQDGFCGADRPHISLGGENTTHFNSPLRPYSFAQPLSLLEGLECIWPRDQRKRRLEEACQRVREEPK